MATTGFRLGFWLCSSRKAFTFVRRDKSKQKHASSTPFRSHKIVDLNCRIGFFLFPFCSPLFQKVNDCYRQFWSSVAQSNGSWVLHRFTFKQLRWTCPLLCYVLKASQSSALLLTRSCVFAPDIRWPLYSTRFFCRVRQGSSDEQFKFSSVILHFAFCILHSMATTGRRYGYLAVLSIILHFAFCILH